MLEELQGMQRMLEGWQGRHSEELAQVQQELRSRTWHVVGVTCDCVKTRRDSRATILEREIGPQPGRAVGGKIIAHSQARQRELNNSPQPGKAVGGAEREPKEQEVETGSSWKRGAG